MRLVQSAGVLRHRVIKGRRQKPDPKLYAGSGKVDEILRAVGEGLTENERRFLDTVVSIPMPGPVESLNVAIAGSVIVFEILNRSRRAPTVSSGDKEAPLE